MEPVPQEPCARRTIFVAFRTAAIELWGPDALRQLGERMPEGARRETIKPSAIAREWLPEAHVMAWYEAAWEGPCGRRERDYLGFIDRMMDHGFGRVRKLLLSMAMTPLSLAVRCAALWRHDHTHGTLTAEQTGGREMLLTLRDHVYMTTELSRRSVVEIYRYASTLTRCKEASASHTMQGARLLVHIKWK
jgi:hypothetical protein